MFALALALGAGGLVAAATALTTAIASVHRASAGSHQVVLAGLRFTYPTVNGSGALLLAIAALGAAAVTIAARELAAAPAVPGLYRSYRTPSSLLKKTPG